MPHTNKKRIVPPDDLIAGESHRLKATVTNDDGTAKNINGATISWWLLPEQGDPTTDALLSDADADVSAGLVGDGSDGRFDVYVRQDVTVGLAGPYWQRVDVDDSGDGLQIYHGPLHIDEP